jgi:hypothetical protein
MMYPFHSGQRRLRDCFILPVCGYAPAFRRRIGKCAVFREVFAVAIRQRSNLFLIKKPGRCHSDEFVVREGTKYLLEKRFLENVSDKPRKVEACM